MIHWNWNIPAVYFFLHSTDWWIGNNEIPLYITPLEFDPLKEDYDIYQPWLEKSHSPPAGRSTPPSPPAPRRTTPLPSRPMIKVSRRSQKPTGSGTATKVKPSPVTFSGFPGSIPAPILYRARAAGIPPLPARSDLSAIFPRGRPLAPSPPALLLPGTKRSTGW